MDNVIESYEFYDYKTPLSENINDPGAEFPIVVYNEDIVTDPHHSKLVINGRLTVKQTAAKPEDPATAITQIKASEIRFIYNAILHLFDRIDYYIGDTKVDSVRKPGTAIALKSIISRRYRENDNCLAGFNLTYGGGGGGGGRNSTDGDSYHNNANESGYFTFSYPMAEIMGFFEDCEKYIIRMPQKLIFTRSTALCNNCLYSEKNDYIASIDLKEISWRVPQVKFNLSYENQLRKEILKNTRYDLQFRHWYYQSTSPPQGSTEFTWDLPVAFSKTKYVVVAFQNDRHDQLNKQNECFDFLDTESIQVLLNNNVYYPRERLNLKLSEMKVALAYEMMIAFRKSYYNSKDGSAPMDLQQFIKHYPIFVIDCSHQPDVIKESLINIKILFSWRSGIPNNKCIIHSLMIMDRKTVYNPLNNIVLS